MICCASFAQTGFNAEALLKQKPQQQRLVNDYTNTLTGEQAQALEAKLDAYDDSTSTQIAVVIVPDVGGDDISDYNVKLGRAWGVGGSQFNNGVVLLIAKDEHKLNIATGYGAEGALPDVTAKHIIDEVIVPNFKGDDYYRGVDQGTDAIMQALKGEYKAPENYRSRKKSGAGSIFTFIIIVIVLIIMFSGRGGGGNYLSRRGGSTLANTLFWSSFLGGGGGSGCLLYTSPSPRD